MEDMIKETCRLALRTMFNNEYFSICTIDSLIKLTNIIPDPNSYKIMQALHCTRFDVMETEFRNKLLKMVIDLFKSDGFDLEEIDKVYASKIIDISDNSSEKKKSIISRLLKN
jgi:hypothetical protein